MSFALQMKWPPHRTTTARPGGLLQTNKQSLLFGAPRHPDIKPRLTSRLRRTFGGRLTMDADETVPLRRSSLPTTSTVVQGSGGLAGWRKYTHTRRLPRHRLVQQRRRRIEDRGKAWWSYKKMQIKSRVWPNRTTGAGVFMQRRR